MNNGIPPENPNNNSNNLHNTHDRKIVKSDFSVTVTQWTSKIVSLFAWYIMYAKIFPNL